MKSSMRKIAFRVWDSNSGRMFVPTWEEIGGIVEYPNLNSHFHLMQYTGLHDKNGKEIWEGDIFKRNGHIGKVEWGISGWLVLFDDGRRIDLWADNKLDWEVGEQEIIGNIYENPELIK